MHNPKKKPADQTLDETHQTLYVNELIALSNLPDLASLKKKADELKESFSIKELLSCYHLCITTLKDLLEAKDMEMKKLRLRLEEFALDSPNALQVLPGPRLAELERKGEQIEEALKKSEDKLERLDQDFENYRKRTEKRIQEIVEYANEQLLSKLLPTLDDFERALGFKTEKNAESVVEGIKMIQKQLETILEKEGVTVIPSTGKPFNPKLHEASEQVATDAVPEETVLEELRKGYLYKGKTLRPALVKVSKAP